MNNLLLLTLIIQGNHNHCGLSSSKNCAYTYTKNTHSITIFNIKQIVFNLGCELTCTVNSMSCNIYLEEIQSNCNIQCMYLSYSTTTLSFLLVLLKPSRFYFPLQLIYVCWQEIPFKCSEFRKRTHLNKLCDSKKHLRGW